MTFFEIYFTGLLIFIGFFTLVQIFSTGITTWLLLKISGVTQLEKTLVNTKPVFQKYSTRTSEFIPWCTKSTDK